jgi:hypothetical protein
MVAQTACCGFNSNFDRATPVSCEYHGERMTWASASSKCENFGFHLCSFDKNYVVEETSVYSNKQCDTVFTGYKSAVKFWSTFQCNIVTTISKDGYVSISHESEVAFDTLVPTSTANLRQFRVLWHNNVFPTVSARFMGFLFLLQR